MSKILIESKSVLGDMAHLYLVYVDDSGNGNSEFWGHLTYLPKFWGHLTYLPNLAILTNQQKYDYIPFLSDPPNLLFFQHFIGPARKNDKK